MITLLLLNGGIGARLKRECPKPFIRLNSTPLIIYSLRAISDIREISHIIVNYPHGWKDTTVKIINQYGIDQSKITYVPAGNTRQASVNKMLRQVKTETVIIHESARPLVEASDFRALINFSAPNVTQTLPLYFTVLQKKAQTNLIGKILDRDLLLNIQLPQKFVFEELKIAHQHALQHKKTYTEDASLLFDCGFKVNFINGAQRNFKITTPEDLSIAEFILRQEAGIDEK